MGAEPHDVDYRLLDPFKRIAQKIASGTDTNIERLGLTVVRESRGESAFLIRGLDGRTPALLATVPETLGTKNLVADRMREVTGRSYYDQIAQDAVAMNVNDLLTVGALPVVVGPHVAAGSSEWFADEERAHDLATGWKHACDLSRCVYGPGESPALVDLVRPDSAVISGFGLGIVRVEAQRISSRRLRAGDAIVFLESSGIHANGLTDARRLADRLTNGYQTRLSNGVLFGEALLAPTHIYVSAVEACQDAEIDLHYVANITGHGWRKLMRAREPFRYVVHDPPKPSPLFEFLIENLGLSVIDAYGTFNMGAGFALFVDPQDADRVAAISSQQGLRAWVAGDVTAASERSVEVPALHIVFPESSLKLR
jgi:phosphoribosylformylglycinamidine cyclo-ligase